MILVRLQFLTRTRPNCTSETCHNFGYPIHRFIYLHADALQVWLRHQAIHYSKPVNLHLWDFWNAPLTTAACWKVNSRPLPALFSALLWKKTMMQPPPPRLDHSDWGIQCPLGTQLAPAVHYFWVSLPFTSDKQTFIDSLADWWQACPAFRVS